MFVLLLSTAIGISTVKAQFIREYSIVTGENQDWPVDVNYEKTGTNGLYFSYHYSTQKNMPFLRYDATTYASLGGYDISNGMPYDPQAMVQSGNTTAVLFNDDMSTVAQPAYNVVKFDHTTGTLSWPWHYPVPGSDVRSVVARDITIDERDRWIYVVADMTDGAGRVSIYIAKIDYTTGIPIWWNMYSNGTYDFATNNIFYYSKDEIYVGAGAANPADAFDRGSYIMEINSAGTLINSTFLRYQDDCIRNQMTTPCVKRYKDDLYAFCPSFMQDLSRRGDYYFAKMDATLAGFPLTAYTVFDPKSFYVYKNVSPKFEFVNSNKNVMVSGISSAAVSSVSGYVHATYDMGTTAYSGGYVYPVTNTFPDGDPIMDAYNPATDQVFSAAEDFGRAPLYYGLRSKPDGYISDDCNKPFEQEHVDCILVNKELDVDTRQLHIFREDLQIQLKEIRQDYDLICGYQDGSSDRSLISTPADAVPAWNVYPNPASSLLEIGYGSNIRTIVITNIRGERLKVITNVNAQHTVIDINELPEGMYFIHATGSDGTSVDRKFIKE